MTSSSANTSCRRVPRRYPRLGRLQTAYAALVMIAMLLAAFSEPTGPARAATALPTSLFTGYPHVATTVAKRHLGVPLPPPPRPPDNSGYTGTATTSIEHTAPSCDACTAPSRHDGSFMALLHDLPLIWPPPAPPIYHPWPGSAYTTMTSTTATGCPTNTASLFQAPAELMHRSLCDPHVIKRMALVCLRKEPLGMPQPERIRWLKRHGRPLTALYTMMRDALLAVLLSPTTWASSPAPLRK